MRVAAGLALIAVALAALAVAFGERASSPMRVSAAASLAEVFPRIEPNARFAFAGSNALALQIREGASADVVAFASPRYTRALHRDGLVERPVVFAYNRLVVVVPAGNPARIRSVSDVARDGVKLVVAGPAVPAGLYTTEVLRRLGLTAAIRNVVSRESDVKGVVAKVALGDADAGFVYRTDARAAAGRVRTVAIPARAQPAVRYELAVTAATADEAAARAFVRRVLGPVGRGNLSRAGFVLPRR